MMKLVGALMKKTALALPLILALLIPSVANAEFMRSYSSSDPNVNYTHFFLTVYSPDNNQTCKSTLLLNFSVEWTDYPRFAGFPSPPAPVMKGLYSYTIDNNPAVTVTSNQSSTDQFDPRGFKVNPTFSYLLDVSNLTNGYHKIAIKVGLTNTESYVARYINKDTPIQFFVQNPTPKDSPIPEFPSIYIRPDGRVDGTNRIQQQGDVYTFKSDIANNSLVILRDNVTIDGQNFTLYGNSSSSSVGISLSARNNVTIKNVAITNFQTGINFDNTSHSKVIDSTITTNNWESGIKLTNSTSNIISNNAVYSDVNYYSPSVHGIVLENSSNNTISENEVTGSFYKAIYLDISNNNTLLDNSVTKSQYGIDLNLSSNNNLIGNTVFSTVRVISRGVYSDDGTGIWLEHNSTHNQILKNNVENNGEAMRIWDFSSNNIIYENNFINNTSQISILTRGEPELRYTPIPNSWDNSTVGNYWSDYNSTDSDGDGIGDSPYIIDENNQDNYPILTMNYFYPPKDDHLNHDWVAEFFSAIVGFSTSTIGIIFLVVTFFIIGLIISLVIFAKQKESYRKSKILDKNAFLFR
jgi:parallel beta-helix repeat protein